MAILSKIRERSIFLIIIIALALFSFVIGDALTSGKIGSNQNSVGEINGENISREEFAELVEQYSANTGNRSSQLQNVNYVWDNLVREKVYESQLKKSGIVLGEKDVWDEILKQPFVQNNPQFRNEAGLFDEEMFKEYVASLKDGKDEDEQSKLMWLSWLNFERNIKSNLEIRAYNNLIAAGLGATLKEGERYYFDNNTKLDIEYVYVPYTYISDSLVAVTDDEIKDYVKKHPDQYRSEGSADVSFVKFDIKATPEDEAEIKNKLAELINDSEKYSTAAKTNVTIKGLSTTDNVEDFFREHSSDTPLDNNYYFKSRLNKEVADSLVALTIGEVYGPYKEGEFFKISKLVDTKQLPDSAKARHILVPYLGSLRADQSIVRTKEEAKKLADSVLTVVKSDKTKFAEIAKDLSSDRTSAEKGGDLGWFTYDRMVPAFRDFSFEGKTGDMDVVESDFGFHIIEIEGQKNNQQAVKLATFSRKIEASEATISTIYQKAETFASDLTNGKDINELAKENSVTVQPVIGLQKMDERVSTLGNQRQIVNWAFNKDTKENDIKRFDVEKGFAVVKLNAKRKKGLSIGSDKPRIRTMLLNEKKAATIKEKIQGDDLAEIAKTFDKTVGSANAVSLGSPMISGVGRAQDLITTLLALEEGKVYKGISTQNGVFIAKILKKDVPPTIDNYSGYTSQVQNSLKMKSGRSYQVLKELAEIEDNRAVFY